MKYCCSIFVVVVAVFVGYLIGSSPTSKTPMFMPEGSVAQTLPPWPIFRVAVAVNDFFVAAARLTTPPPVRAKNLATAYWDSEVIHSLTKTGVFDTIYAAGGTASCASVASKLELVEPFLCRVMRAGVGLGVLDEKQGDFSLSALGDYFRSDHPMSQRAFTLMINDYYQANSWRAALTDGLKSGKGGMEQYYGESFFDFVSKPERSQSALLFDEAMKSFSHEQVGSLLVDWAPSAPDAVVCDIGGGLGHMLVNIAEHYPQLRGIVFDLPDTVARASNNIASAGFAGRLRALGGSFFERLPTELGTCDIFFMKFILHDWSDAQNVEILKNIAAVSKPSASLVTADFILGTQGFGMEAAKAGMDLNMMQCCPVGARERTREEYFSLFRAAGITAQPNLIMLRDLFSAVEVKLH